MHIPWRKRVDAKFAKNIESGYMRGFKFDPFDNPRLKELGQRYYLDEVVAVRSGIVWPSPPSNKLHLRPQRQGNRLRFYGGGRSTLSGRPSLASREKGALAEPVECSAAPM